jgi:phosphatidylglycerol:prolipoprotein diacylglycerol transferase
VEPGSPAAQAGLEKGDLMTQINGEEVNNATELASYFANPENWRGRSWSVQLTVRKPGPNSTEETLEFAPKTLPIHPTQVYESISMLLLFLLLTAFYPFRRHDGEVMALLMIGYGVHRYFNEMLRADARPTGFENNISILLLLGGVAILVWLWHKPIQYREGKAIAAT